MTFQPSRWFSKGFGVALVTSVIAAGCGGSQPPAAEQTPAAPKVATPAERVAWYQNCWALFNSKNWDAFKGCYADDIESATKDVSMMTVKGADAVIASSKQLAVAFPDLKGTTQLILANGDSIFSIALMTGTHTGPLKGADGKDMPATNKSIGYLMAHIVQGNAAGDKVLKEATYQDNGTFMNQLGLSPAPGRPLMTSSAAAPTIVTGTGSETERANAGAFRAQADAFNAHDVAAVDAFSAPDAVFHDQSQAKDMDAKANAAMMKGFFTAFSDAKLTLASVWGAGDYTVTEGTFSGTNNAAFPWMGIAKATNKSVSAPFIEVTRWQDGKIKEDWMFVDSLIFAAQLGLLPPK